MSDYQILLSAFGGVALVSLILSVLLGSRVLRLSRQIVVLQEGLQERGRTEGAALVEKRASQEVFGPALATAQIRTRLQERGPLREPPAKYSHVVSLTEHGLDSSQIAKVLNLAPEEAEQLVSLARATRRESRELSDTSRFKREALQRIAKDFPESRRNDTQAS